MFNAYDGMKDATILIMQIGIEQEMKNSKGGRDED